MAKHAQASSASSSGRRSLQALLEWHEGRQRASLGSPRGWLWMVLIAAVFFWMSNPLVFVPGFHLSLSKAITWTTIAVVATLPWLRLPRVPWPWIVFHLLCVLSALWTIDPHLTEYTNILYLKITVIAVVIAANCESAVVGWGMGLGGATVVALSLYAFEQEMWGASNAAIGGALITGVGTNENILAYTVSLAVAAMLGVGRPDPVPAQVAWFLLLAVNVAGIVIAGSGSGYLTALCLAMTVGLIRAWPRLRHARPRAVLAGVLAVGLTLLLGLLFVVVGLGKELSTFSGRAPFWRAAIEVTFERAPALGAGWGAVWQHPWNMVPPNQVADAIYTRAGYQLSHGHNLLVDVLPELGLVGVATAMLLIAYVIRSAARLGVHGRSRNSIGGRLTLMVAVSLFVFGLTEPMLTVPLGWWTLAMVAAFATETTPNTSKVASEAERSGSDSRLALSGRGRRRAG